MHCAGRVSFRRLPGAQNCQHAQDAERSSVQQCVLLRQRNRLHKRSVCAAAAAAQQLPALAVLFVVCVRAGFCPTAHPDALSPSVSARTPPLCPDPTSPFVSCFFPLAGSPPPPPPDTIPCDLGQTGSGNTDCQDCPAGKYKPVTGNLACTACPAGSTTGSTKSTAQTDCKCNAGYTGPNGGPCSACPAGTYKNLIGKDMCSPCAADTQSPQGSASCR